MSSASSASLESAPVTVKRPILKVSGLRKTHQTTSGDLTVLKDVSLSLEAGDTLAIVGPSGSGKTTLLGLCAGLDDASAGSVELDGMALEGLDQDARAALRNRLVGFVFQSFQLIPTLTAIENVLVPLELRGESGKGIRKEAERLLAEVGLGERLDHYPLQLSGGEQQRVALARAFIHRPKILFADEPTGNLDAGTSEPIVEMLFRLNRDAGTALVLVTHDPGLAAKARRVVTMSGGMVVSEEENDV
ncbi:MAG: ATP-binding cassette domain-containing protein [Akkermansiaceae bacterium]|jgi:putative ABC transport system ATP-binding protein|nr:ATP-binding cassette domain-containing protein [Akkermansiaceae bacterium]MDP4645775.1 ATP-binding cassette domain-containing protein [Akkermansiaceae bacterium]MDP4847584.1 ATP-binding cassette domain-containing protein [Akkermansiaceae bacterium]MDP4994826.1 ATP-binding cassette domain-containing protein [Akkermansiaceae bacterium]